MLRRAIGAKRTNDFKGGMLRSPQVRIFSAYFAFVVWAIESRDMVNTFSASFCSILLTSKLQRRKLSKRKMRVMHQQYLVRLLSRMRRCAHIFEGTRLQRPIRDAAKCVTVIGKYGGSEEKKLVIEMHAYIYFKCCIKHLSDLFLSVWCHPTERSMM